MVVANIAGVKECRKKFPSVHNKRKGKGWKRALTSNSGRNSILPPSSKVERKVQFTSGGFPVFFLNKLRDVTARIAGNVGNISLNHEHDFGWLPNKFSIVNRI